MSTFTPQKPKPGWEKRWPLEAAQLVFRTPGLVAAVMAAVLVLGFFDTVLTDVSYGYFIHLVLTWILGVPLIAWVFHRLGKHERYVDGPFTGAKEAIQTGLPFMVAVIPIIIILGIMMAASGPLPETPPASARSQWMDTWSFGVGYLVSGFIISYQGMFTLLVIPMVNAGPEQNAIIQKKSHEQLVSVFKNATLYAFLAMIVLNTLLPPYITFLIYVFFIYVVYVAGREIIGGITGNTQESAALAPQSA